MYSCKKDDDGKIIRERILSDGVRLFEYDKKGKLLIETFYKGFPFNPLKKRYANIYKYFYYYNSVDSVTLIRRYATSLGKKKVQNGILTTDWKSPWSQWYLYSETRKTFNDKNYIQTLTKINYNKKNEKSQQFTEYLYDSSGKLVQVNITHGDTTSRYHSESQTNYDVNGNDSIIIFKYTNHKTNSSYTTKQFIKLNQNRKVIQSKSEQLYYTVYVNNTYDDNKKLKSRHTYQTNNNNPSIKKKEYYHLFSYDSKGRLKESRIRHEKPCFKKSVRTYYYENQ